MKKIKMPYADAKAAIHAYNYGAPTALNCLVRSRGGLIRAEVVLTHTPVGDRSFLWEDTSYAAYEGTLELKSHEWTRL